MKMKKGKKTACSEEKKDPSWMKRYISVFLYRYIDILMCIYLYKCCVLFLSCVFALRQKTLNDVERNAHDDSKCFFLACLC